MFKLRALHAQTIFTISLHVAGLFEIMKGNISAKINESLGRMETKSDIVLELDRDLIEDSRGLEAEREIGASSHSSWFSFN